MENIFSKISALLDYGIEVGLIGKYDRMVAQNYIMKSLKLEEFKYEEVEKKEKISNIEFHINEILEGISEYAVNSGVIENSGIVRELLETELMGHLTPSNSNVIEKFFKIHKESPEKAAKSFYNFSKITNYIRMDRIAKNLHWYSPTLYGNLEITINLSKPEKDPADIAREKLMVAKSYPKCLLCYENVGYQGRINHPARQNHRVIPVTLGGEEWFLQYSPYVYYNEHGIVFSSVHRDMKIDRNSFIRLLDFVDFLPNYFVGSNADLPIVGGSILSHDHFQGGNHEFPMEKAEIERYFSLDGYSDVKVGVVNWPMSVIRLQSKDREKIVELSDKILVNWRGYSDESVDILSHSGNIPHNTITPISRKNRFNNELYEMDLVLRNNRTTDEHPLGIFHPHSEVHHIKKENIGLIEVMGLAVLPGRLKEEIKIILDIFEESNPLEAIEKNSDVKKHLQWLVEIVEKRDFLNISREKRELVLKEEIGIRFATVLTHAGVFKRDEIGQSAFDRFINSL